VSFHAFSDSSTKLITTGRWARLNVWVCQRLMSLITSDAFCRFLKLTRPPGRMSGFPSWMNCRVERKTPISQTFSVQTHDPRPHRHTNEWHTRRRDRCHKLPILVKVPVTVNRGFASMEDLQMALVDLLPCPLQPTNGRSVETRRDGDHTRKVVQRPTALEPNKPPQQRLQ
jgi:hypothetical protein